MAQKPNLLMEILTNNLTKETRFALVTNFLGVEMTEEKYLYQLQWYVALQS